jgi:hypothetical protein
MLPELFSASKGKFALIFNEKLIGIFTSKDDALNYGLEKIGNNEFLIREILPIQEPLYFFHGIGICPS